MSLIFGGSYDSTRNLWRPRWWNRIAAWWYRISGWHPGQEPPATVPWVCCYVCGDPLPHYPYLVRCHYCDKPICERHQEWDLVGWEATNPEPYCTPRCEDRRG